MSNKKQSSVEFLIERIMETYDITNPELIKAMVKSIAMHKAEIMDAHINGYNSSGSSAEDYYEHTFK